MPSLIWTEAASQGVLQAYRFMVVKDGRAARLAVTAIRTATAGLAEHPLMGRPAEDAGPEYRELVIPFGGGSYVALYRPTTQGVFILAVRHAKEAGY